MMHVHLHIRALWTCCINKLHEHAEADMDNVTDKESDMDTDPPNNKEEHKKLNA